MPIHWWLVTCVLSETHFNRNSSICRTRRCTRQSPYFCQPFLNTFATRSKTNGPTISDRSSATIVLCLIHRLRLQRQPPPPPTPPPVQWRPALGRSVGKFYTDHATIRTCCGNARKEWWTKSCCRPSLTDCFWTRKYVTRTRTTIHMYCRLQVCVGPSVFSDHKFSCEWNKT